MKAKWILASAVVVLASCEKPAPIIAEAPQRKMPSPTRIQETPSEPVSSPAPKNDAAPSVAKAPPAPKNPPAPPAPQPVPRPGAPEAQAVPNQPGFVFSPFSNKIVDVRELPSGTLVADPTYPPEEKKHFRVP
ncbi:MAG TPA: hypothetical protein VM511_03385 [Luteolibacter sp.]|nr:hypothetical protein [Luteolibacter sp.]